jgi:hypothetical protein
VETSDENENVLKAEKGENRFTTFSRQIPTYS